MEISLEKYEAMQDRIAQLETAIDIKSKQFDYALDLVVARDDVIYALRAKQPHWISVKDRLPNCNEPELVCSEFGGVGIAYFDADGNWYGEYQDVTYWMPLPESPKGN